jgi:hypothetical protein
MNIEYAKIMHKLKIWLHIRHDAYKFELTIHFTLCKKQDLK